MEKRNNDDGNKKKILIIDDEVDITFTFKVGLEDTGLFTVDTFNDPQDLLLNFKPVIYDLILLDIRMPKMSGYELYKEIRKIDAEIKVIFLTATEEEIMKKTVEHIWEHHAIKPEEMTSEMKVKIKENIVTL